MIRCILEEWAAIPMGGASISGWPRDPRALHQGPCTTGPSPIPLIPQVAAQAGPAAPPVHGVALVNCAGGLNNKAVSEDWRARAARPLFLLIDALLARRRVARWLFDKYRSPENIRSILLVGQCCFHGWSSGEDGGRGCAGGGGGPQQMVLTPKFPPPFPPFLVAQKVYRDPASVDDELVQMLHAPSCQPGALEAFVSIMSGPPGPQPKHLVPDIGCGGKGGGV